MAETRPPAYSPVGMARIVSPILCVLCVLCGKEVGFPSRTFALNAPVADHPSAGFFAAHSTRLLPFSGSLRQMDWLSIA
jgi:hypothetical protein